MLTALAILGVLVALFLAAALATRESEALAPVSPDRADSGLPDGEVRADDLRRVRFGLAARGYRMSEVDAVLERLAAQLEERDRQLGERTTDVVEEDRASVVDLTKTDTKAPVGSAATAVVEPVDRTTPDPEPAGVQPAAAETVDRTVSVPVAAGLVDADQATGTPAQSGDGEAPAAAQAARASGEVTPATEAASPAPATSVLQTALSETAFPPSQPAEEPTAVVEADSPGVVTDAGPSVTRVSPAGSTPLAAPTPTGEDEPVVGITPPPPATPPGPLFDEPSESTRTP